MRGVRLSTLLALLVLNLPSLTYALPKPEHKAAKQMLAGPLYLRIEAPLRLSATAYVFGMGVKEPLFEVTPTEVRPVKADAPLVSWEVGVNDRVHLEDFEVENDGVIHVDLEGDGREKRGILHFVGIESLADFKAAFDLAFSRVPLQDENPDWTPEVRQAIAEHRVIDGMTKRQVAAVVGLPESFSERDEDGKHIETWKLSFNHGQRSVLYLTVGNPPGTLRFEDGKLIGAGQTGRRVKLGE